MYVSLFSSLLIFQFTCFSQPLLLCYTAILSNTLSLFLSLFHFLSLSLFSLSLSLSFLSLSLYHSLSLSLSLSLFLSISLFPSLSHSYQWWIRFEGAHEAPIRHSWTRWYDRNLSLKIKIKKHKYNNHVKIISRSWKI